MSIVDKVRQLSNLNNLTAEDIGDKLNCTWRTVVNIAQENDIEITTEWHRNKNARQVCTSTKNKG